MTTPLVCHVDGRSDPEIFLCGGCNVPICSLHASAPSGRHLPEDHKSKEKEPMARAQVEEDDDTTEESEPAGGESGKISRGLGLTISPRRGGKFNVTIADRTTRSKESDRVKEEHVSADTWENQDAAVEAFRLILKGFAKSLKNEDQGKLFADEKSAKAKMDK